jgi:hypothetical protein
MQAKGKRTVTFVNEDKKSRVKLTIRDKETGKVLKTKNLSAKGSWLENVPFVGDSFDFKISDRKRGIEEYAIEAKETNGDSLETGIYSLHLRSQDDTGTVRIVRSSFLIGEEKLSFVGNAEEDEGGAFVRKLLLTPSWAK